MLAHVRLLEDPLSARAHQVDSVTLHLRQEVEDRVGGAGQLELSFAAHDLGDGSVFLLGELEGINGAVLVFSIVVEDGGLLVGLKEYGLLHVGLMDDLAIEDLRERHRVVGLEGLVAARVDDEEPLAPRVQPLDEVHRHGWRDVDRDLPRRASSVLVGGEGIVAGREESGEALGGVRWTVALSVLLARQIDLTAHLATRLDRSGHGRARRDQGEVFWCVTGLGLEGCDDELVRDNIPGLARRGAGGQVSHRRDRE